MKQKKERKNLIQAFIISKAVTINNVNWHLQTGTLI